MQVIGGFCQSGNLTDDSFAFSFKISATMQLILQSIFCCCLLATVAPSADSAKHDLKRR